MRRLKLSRILPAIIVILAALACKPASAATDTEGHWAEEIINYGISQGYVSGYADGSFKPDYPIKRAEFVALANRYMGFSAIWDVNFPDVSRADWFYNDIAAALREGYISGYPDGTFRPNAEITRETAAVMAANILHLAPNTEYAAYFTDAERLSWSRGAVGAAVKAKLISGYTNGEFRPAQALTRAEAAALLSRVAGKKYDNTLDVLPAYRDYYTSYDTYDTNIYGSHMYPGDGDYYRGTGVATATEPDKDGYYRIYNGNYGSNTETENFYGNIMYDPTHAGTVKNIYVSGDFALTSNISRDSELTMEDVTIRGKLIIYSIGRVTLNRCDINQIEFRSDRSGAEIYAGAGTIVRDTKVFRSVRLTQETTTERGFRSVSIDENCRERDTLTLAGDFAYVSVGGRRANLVVEKGVAETVEVDSGGSDCDIEVKSGATVEYMDIRAGCYVHGNGKIVRAKITADGVVFDLIPQSVTGTREPEYTDTADNSGEGTGYSVEIIVVNDSNSGQQGVSVRLGDFDEVYTSSSGKAIITNVPDGDYVCYLTAQYVKPAALDVTVSGRNVSITYVYDATPKYDVTIKVMLNGLAVEGALVNLGSRSALTDANGLAVFSELTGGTYDCSASYNGQSGYISVRVENINVYREVELR